MSPAAPGASGDGRASPQQSALQAARAAEAGLWAVAAAEAWTRGSAARRRGLAVAAAEEEPWIRGAAAHVASRATHVPPPPPPDQQRLTRTGRDVVLRVSWSGAGPGGGGGGTCVPTGWQMNVVHLVQRRRRWLISFAVAKWKAAAATPHANAAPAKCVVRKPRYLPALQRTIGPIASASNDSWSDRP